MLRRERSAASLDRPHLTSTSNDNSSGKLAFNVEYSAIVTKHSGRLSIPRQKSAFDAGGLSLFAMDKLLKAGEHLFGFSPYKDHQDAQCITWCTYLHNPPYDIL